MIEPPPVMVRLLPLMVPEPEITENATGRLVEAVAVSETGESPYVADPKGLNVTDCVSAVITITVDEPTDDWNAPLASV